LALLERARALVVAVAALGIGTPAVAGDLTITPSIELREGYSDNVDLGPEGDEESAFISEVVPGVRIRSESARVTGALNAFPILRHQTAGEDEGLSLAGDLAGLGTVEAVEDLFFVDAQASISQQVLDSRAAASTANEETVQVYRISPYLRNRFGGFAEAEARYRLSQVLVGDQAAAGGGQTSDATTHALSLSLESGSDFSRLFWALSSLASEESRSEDDDVSRREADLELRYAVDRSITLIAAAGYQFFDDGTSVNEVGGPTWRVGFRWRPGPRTDLEATYGERNDDQSANVRFSYKIGPRTTLTARYSEILETSQERLVRTLSQIGLEGETDEIIDEETGLPFTPDPSPFDIDNETTRIEAFELGVNGVRGRNTFGVKASFQTEKTEPSGEEEDVIQASARFSRRLNPHTTLSLFAGYERTEFDDGQVDDEYTLTGALNYQIYANVRAGVSYGFRLQDSTVEASEFAENRITANVRMTF
jgi:uncharacterized protein (PEP-CTERM system associated)